MGCGSRSSGWFRRSGLGIGRSWRPSSEFIADDPYVVEVHDGNSTQIPDGSLTPRRLLDNHHRESVTVVRGQAGVVRPGESHEARAIRSRRRVIIAPLPEL